MNLKDNYWGWVGGAVRVGEEQMQALIQNFSQT